MKKNVLVVLSIIILVTLFGCGNKPRKDIVNESVDSNQVTPEEEVLAVEIINEEEIQSTINKKIVVIDPGHSSNGNIEQEKMSPDSDTMKIKDPGGTQGVVTGIPEYVVAMSISIKLKELLQQNGVTVIMTKTLDDESPGNIDRAEVGNLNNADLSIRIHCDSSENQSAHGASVLVPAAVGYAKDISGVSSEYGNIILSDLVDTVGMDNRGVIERSDLTGFNWSKVPVILVEMGFMSNPEEDKLLSQDEYQNKLAQGLCNGILNSLNLETVEY